MEMFVLIDLSDPTKMVTIQKHKPKSPRFWFGLRRNSAFLKHEVTPSPSKYSNVLFLQHFHRQRRMEKRNCKWFSVPQLLWVKGANAGNSIQGSSWCCWGLWLCECRGCVWDRPRWGWLLRQGWRAARHIGGARGWWSWAVVKAKAVFLWALLG